MFIDDYTEKEFGAFAHKNGYELVSLNKRNKKQAMFDVTLKVAGTSVEIDFIATDYEFKTITHRTRGLTANISGKWQHFNGDKHGDLYWSCLNNNVNFIPF